MPGKQVKQKATNAGSNDNGGPAAAGLSETSTSSRMGTVACGVAALVFIVTVFIALYAPALSLPWALIDEALYLENLDKVWARWWEIGFFEALRADVGTVTQGYKPGAFIAYSIGYSLFNESRLAMHAVLLFFLFITITAAAVTPWLVARRNSEAAFPRLLILSGTAASFLILGAEVPGWSNFQSFRANWFRLHTSEALIAPCLAIHVILLLLGLLKQGWRRVVLISLSLVFVLLAGTTKLTAFAHLGPPLVLAVLLFVARHSAYKVVGLVSLISVAASLVYTAYMRHITPDTGSTYFTSYEISRERINASWDFYRTSFRDMLGPIFPLLIPAFIARLICQWKGYGSWRVALDRHLVLIYLLLGWCASVVAALPWQHLLPRYLLPAHVLLCYAIGLEIYFQGIWILSLERRRWWLAAIAAGAGIAAIILLPFWMVALLLLVGALISLSLKTERVVQGFILGIFSLSLAYFCTTTIISREALKRALVTPEHVNGELIDFMMEQFEAKKSVGVLGGTEDERFGSMAIYAMRKDLSPVIRPVMARKDLAGMDLLLIEDKHSRAAPPPMPMRKVKSFHVEPLSVQFMSFMEWRERLKHGHLVWPSAPAQLPLGWSVYEVPPAS